MNTLRNKVNLIGNLGLDPEILTTETGKKLVRFNLATNEFYRNSKGEKVVETQWHQLVAWGKTADLAERMLIKGIRIAIEGKIVNRTYLDRNGIKKFTSEVHISKFLVLSPAKIEKDDLPF